MGGECGVVCGEFGVWCLECGDYTAGMRAASGMYTGYQISRVCHLYPDQLLRKTSSMSY